MSNLKYAIPSLNSRIAYIRKDKHLTQQKFASYLQVSRSYLSEVENGKGKPSIEMLTGINRCFTDINPDWLLSGKGTIHREEKQNPKWLTDWWENADEDHKRWLKIQLQNTQ